MNKDVTHTHTGILLSHKKKMNSLLPFVATCIDLEDIMLSEIVRQRKKNTVLDISHMWNLTDTTN